VKTLYVYMMTNRSRGGAVYRRDERPWPATCGSISTRSVAGFTSRYKVDRLVYYELYERPSDAIGREKELKAWRRSKKNALVETLNPKWADLSGDTLQPMRDPSPSSRLGMTTNVAARPC
jgi:putative endonuclease